MTDTSLNPVANESPAVESAGWLQHLPGVLRAAGAAAVLISLYTFLARGWEGSTDVFRYAMLLGHTGLLSALALASGKILREGKGPRILMMLSLIAAVVNFAILGAFIFAGSGAAAGIAYPTYVTWHTDSLATALMWTAGAMLVLIPVIRFGFMTLARGISGRMTIAFLVSNAALLLPLRDPVLVTVAAIMLAGFSLWLTSTTARQRFESHTLEGRFALLLQFLPVAVLLGRNLWLYGPGFSLATGITLTAFVMLRQSGKLMNSDSSWHSTFNLLSSVLALLSGLFAGSALEAARADESLVILGSTLLSAGLLYDISSRTGARSGAYRSIAMAIATLGLLIDMLFVGNAVSTIVTLVIGIGGLVASYTLQQKAMFFASVVLVIAGMLNLSMEFLQYFDFGSWFTLAGSGMLAIVAGSWLESRGTQVRARMRDLKSHTADWEA